MPWDRVDEVRINPLFSRWTCSDVQGNIMPDFTGVAMLTGTAVHLYHNRMLGYGLPFRVDVRGTSIVATASDGEQRSGGFALPPCTINPVLMNGLNSWPAFLHLMTEQLTYLAQELQRSDTSDVVWVGLKSLRLTYVPLNNLGAFLPHLQGQGGGAKHELPAELLHKTCVVNIQNDDNQCLRCCLISWKIDPGHHAGRWSKCLTNYPRGSTKPRGWKPIYKECGLDLACLPYDRAATLHDVTAVEQANAGLGIYVYMWQAVKVDDVQQCFPVLLRPPPDPRNVVHEVLLLLYGKHFYRITDFQRFMSQQSFKVSRFSRKNTNAARTCHRCLINHKTDASLQKHLEKCDGVWDEPELPARLPSEKVKGDKLVVCFQENHHKFMHPLIVYADIETFFGSLDSGVSDNTHVYGENRRIASVGMHAVASGSLTLPEEFQAQIFVVDGVCDPFTEFMRRLMRLAMYWRFCRTNLEELAMTPAAWFAFQSAKSCEHCKKDFSRKVVKCRDHDHVTGAYRAALCSSCNAKARIPNKIKVFTHNGTGYDHHFYLRSLARLQSVEQRDVYTFAGSPDWVMPGSKATYGKWRLEDFKLEVLAESTEKMRAITLKKGDICIDFLDSLKFLKASVGELIASQKKAFPDLSSGFPHMANFHPAVDTVGGRTHETLEMLLRKVPFPYSAMRDIDFFARPALLDKEAYFNELRQKHISNEEYEEMRHIVASLSITTMRQWHDLYLYTDVLALADCMEAFRHEFHRSTGLDPFHKLGLPGAAWSALLYNSEAKIQNITSECCGGRGERLMKYVDDNIRGGLSCAFTPYVLANNPNCPESEYVPCDPSEHTWIRDFDATSLYPYCMSMPLPTGDYALQGGTDDGQTRTQALSLLEKVLREYTPEDSRGFMLVVRMEIPEALHDYWDFAPSVNRSVTWEELSERQQRIKCQKYLNGYKDEEKVRRLASLMQAPGHKKLVPDLNPQDRKALHVEHAQELRKYGAVFTELYACYSYTQSPVFKAVLARSAATRAASSSDLVKDVEKLKMNSTYGKTLENKRGRRNIRVHTKVESFINQACFKRTREFDVQQYCPEDGTFLGVTASRKTKGIVLDTPRMMGWAILEYAKMVMMRFHYGTMKKLFPGALKLLYTDTDSLYYVIRWPTDPTDHIAQNNHGIFDLSLVARYKDTPLKGKLGCFKYEGAGNKKGIPGDDNEIVEAVFLAPKSYVKRMAKPKDDSNLKIAGKGVPGSVLQENYGSTIEHFKDAVLKNRVSMATYNQFRSFNHVVKHCTVTKVALSAENDKVFQVSPYESRPLGHVRNKEAEQRSSERDLLHSKEKVLKWDALDSEENVLTLAKKLLADRRAPLPDPSVDDAEDEEASNCGSDVSGAGDDPCED